MLFSVNWNSLLTGCCDIDEAWQRWKTKFMLVMEECIPQTTLPSRRNLPWMTLELTKSLRVRNLLCKRAKRSNSHTLWQKYKMRINKVANQLKSAKKYLSHMTLSDPKLFWKTVKQITKKDRIPCIEGENGDIISNDLKASILNNYFSKYFNNTILHSLKVIVQPTNTLVPENTQNICFALRMKF